MIKLAFLVLLGCSAASLAGAAFFFYRFLVRRRLFPQLPRIWEVDKKRFFMAGSALALSLAALMAMSAMNPPPAPERVPAPRRAPGPASPASPTPTGLAQPSPAPAASQAPARGEERALPPAERPLPGLEVPQPPQANPPGLQETQAPREPPTTPEAPAWATVTSLTSTASTQAPPSSQTSSTSLSSTATTVSTTSSSSATTTAAPTSSATTTSAPQAPTKAAKSPPGRPGAFTVCLGSHRQKAAAQAEQARLKAKGINSQVHAVDLKDKGRWHRVCAGSFDSYQEARQQAQAWERQGLAATPFVVSRPRP